DSWSGSTSEPPDRGCGENGNNEDGQSESDAVVGVMATRLEFVGYGAVREVISRVCSTNEANAAARTRSTEIDRATCLTPGLDTKDLTMFLAAHPAQPALRKVTWRLCWRCGDPAESGPIRG